MIDLCPVAVRLYKISLTLVVGGVLAYWTLLDEPVQLQRWQAVKSEILEHRIGLIGRVVPGVSVTLSAPFEGEIQEKKFADNQRVAKDQVLLSISPDLLQMQIRDAFTERLKTESAVRALNDWVNGEEMARAKRSVSTIEWSLGNTRRRLIETEELFKQGIVPRMELDSLTQQAQTQALDLKAAQAEWVRVSKRAEGEQRQIAEMQYANARSRHEALLALEARGEIRAPFTGLVRRMSEGTSASGAKLIEPGGRVSQGQPLLELASFEQLNVTAKVDESDINKLREGMPVEISGDGFQGKYLGSIAAVGTQAVETDWQGENASYNVTVRLPPLDRAPGEILRLGMSARLSILTYQNPSAIVLPEDAIGEESGQHFIVHRASINAAQTRLPVTLGIATVNGVEVFGINDGFVKREVSMD